MNFRSNTQTQNLVQLPLWLAALLMLLLTTTVSEAAVRATLDRDSVYAGDTLTLTIESDSRQSDLQPDLAPLEKNFEVLGASTQTQVSIFNGRRSDKTLWQVQLQPRQLGQLRIPPIRVGQQQTTALELNVTEVPQQTGAQPNQHVFIEAEADSAKKNIYVQQQIPYSVRLYYDERLQDGELNAPKPENAVIEQLGEDKRYSTVRNGRQYSVIERHYVISPEKSGSLYIPPATFRGHIAVPQQRGRSRGPGSMMEEFFNNSPFANDPFFRNSPFDNPGKPIAIRSRAINIEVKPQPASAQRNWLPAEAVSLHDSWTENPPQFKVGEPVARTITIQTRGLAGSQIPELNITAPANARLYPETPEHESRTDGKTIYGTRSQTLTYIPGAQGALEIPAIHLDWWDTRHNKTASSTLPGWQFKVLPGASGAATEAPTANASQPEQQTDPASKTVETNSKQIESASATLTEAIKSNWRWLLSSSGILLALVLLVVIMARRVKQRHINGTQQTPAKTRPKAKQKTALQTLQKACAANDKHAAARAILDLSHVHWTDDPPASLDALAARIEKGQVPLKELERTLYAANAGDWNGAALWNEFKHGLQEKKQRKQNQDDGLRPLYPQHF